MKFFISKIYNFLKILRKGLSKEEFFAGRSMPRNRELMRVFSDMELVEQLGSGMHRILSTYKNANFKITDNFLEICFLFDGQVNAQVKKLLEVLKNEMNREELMTVLKLKNKSQFRKNYFKPALDLGLIAMTQPNTPNSPTQKYYRVEN